MLWTQGPLQACSRGRKVFACALSAHDEAGAFQTGRLTVSMVSPCFRSNQWGNLPPRQNGIDVRVNIRSAACAVDHGSERQSANEFNAKSTEDRSERYPHTGARGGRHAWGSCCSKARARREDRSLCCAEEY